MGLGWEKKRRPVRGRGRAEELEEWEGGEKVRRLRELGGMSLYPEKEVKEVVLMLR